MGALPEWLSVGELADRSGVATSALRFYESEGLLEATRTPGNQRRFHRSSLRRIGVIRAAQAVGLPLAEVASAFAELPEALAPNRSDWQRISQRWQGNLEHRITELERLRDKLSSCIGCGCLSLESCGLLNTDDRVASQGDGARYLLSDEPDIPPSPG